MHLRIPGFQSSSWAAPLPKSLFWHWVDPKQMCLALSKPSRSLPFPASPSGIRSFQDNILKEEWAQGKETVWLPLPFGRGAAVSGVTGCFRGWEMGLDAMEGVTQPCYIGPHIAYDQPCQILRTLVIGTFHIKAWLPDAKLQNQGCHLLWSP